MIKIAVVDEDDSFAEQFVNEITKEFAEKKIAVQVKPFQSVRGLLGRLDDKYNFDVYFLDVEMKHLSGLELAKRIRSQDSNAMIVLMATHEKYAIEGYACRALGYIVKETWKHKLPGVLERIQQELDSRADQFYRIRTERRHEIIRMTDIYMLEKCEKNTLFYCKENRQYQERCSLSEVYRRLPANTFVYVNRGQIINLRYVTGLKGETVELGNLVSLTVSRSLVNEVRQKLDEYWGRK